MSSTRTILFGILAAIAIAACGSDTGPSAAPGSPDQAPGASVNPSDPGGPPDPDAVVVDQLAGPWRVKPVLVDDARTAIASDACAATAREKLGETEANLPTAMIDARGGHLITVIMADDLNAILCLAHFDDAGTTATVDSVDRLSAAAVAPVEGAAITVVSVVQTDDRPGGRTIAFGRVGPQAADAKVGFGDNTVDLASKGDGWWAIWWPGAVRANSFSAVDPSDLAVGSAKPPAGLVEARTSRATWWVDPNAPRPTATSTTVHALVVEQVCASGKSPKGRIEAPSIDLEDKSVTITIDIRRQTSGQDCQGNPPLAVTITLPEPLGARSLLDGSATPPRDATKAPPG